MAIDGDWAVVGAPTESGPGSASIYRHEGPTWTLLKKQTASDGANDDIFGSTVAVQNGNVLVGAPFKDISGITDLGATYYFTCQECPAITLSALANGAVGTAYNQTITASGTAGPFQFSLSEGSLPPGMILSQAGVVSGAPSKVGTYNFTIQAMTDTLCAGARNYTITIAGNCPTITVNPASMSGGSVGSVFNHLLSALGGVAPYSYSYSGALPPGVSLNQQTGQLLGQLSATGNFNFTIIAADANGCQGSRNYSVIVTQGGGGSATDLQFYPLAHPVRLLDTRVGQTGCDAPGAKITGGTSRTQTAAGRTCDGLTIPANAALVGNATSVQSGGGFSRSIPATSPSRIPRIPITPPIRF